MEDGESNHILVFQALEPPPCSGGMLSLLSGSVFVCVCVWETCRVRCVKVGLCA